MASLIIIFLLCLPIFLFFICQRQRAKTNIKLPPGPQGLPFIGNLHQFDVSKPQVSFWELSKKYGPLMSLRLGFVPTLVVSSAKMAKEILKTHDLQFCSRPALLGQQKLSYNGLDLAFSPHDEYWKEIRKICVVHLFNSNRVQNFRPIREDEVSRMIEKVSKSAAALKPVNLSEIMMSLTSTIICRLGFGKRYEDEAIERSRFHGLLNETEALFVSFFVTDYFPHMGWLDKLTGMIRRLETNFQEFDRFYEELIEEHLDPKRTKFDQHEDIIDVLLQIRKNGGFKFDLTLDHIKAVLMMAPGNRKRATATPSTSARATGPGDFSASTGESSTVKGRGRTRGLGLAKYVKAHGRIRIEISDDGHTQVGQHNSAFNTAIGATARYEAPQNYVSWRKIPWETKLNQLFPSLLEWFDFDLTQVNVQQYIDYHMGKSYKDYRTKVLKPIFDEHGPSNAPQHKPDFIEEQDWTFLCELWSSKKHEDKCHANAENRSHLRFNHRGGSKPFIQHRAEHSESSTCEVQSFPDFFRVTHYNDKNKWINEEAERCYNEMMELQHQTHETETDPIPDEQLSQLVFKNQTAYNVGLGTRKKPTSSARNNGNSDNVSLRDALVTTKDELQQTKEKLQQVTVDHEKKMMDHEKKMEQLEQQLLAFRQMFEASMSHGASGSSVPPSQ